MKNVKSPKFWIENCIFPILLLLYPFVMVNQGADLTDTTYSLGNYLYFERISGNWKYATFLANLFGRFLMWLTGGKMLYMNIMGAFLVATIALVVYFGAEKYVSPLFLFWGEVIAISLCWCPTIIFYNYLSYLILTVAILLIWLAMRKHKPWLLFPAGILLGCNVFVRTSNLTQVALIVLVWFDVWQKKDRKIWKETGICVLGFFLGILAMLGMMILSDGTGAYGEMVNWLISLLTSEDEAGGYSLKVMLLTIWKNYWIQLRWFFLLLLGIIAGMGGFALWKDRFVKIKKIGYMLCVALLYFYFYRNGVFTTTYYNVGSMFSLSVLFLLFCYSVSFWILLDKKFGETEKEAALLNLVLLLILPLGSNNHLYCIINYLFLLAPISLALGYRIFREYGKSILAFPAKAMLGTYLLVFLVQIILFHGTYVFCDGNDGEVRSTRLQAPSLMQGMVTGEMHATCMDELYSYVADSQGQQETLLVYGNLPGLHYFLQKPAALSSFWVDLDSFPKAQFGEEMNALNENGEYPLVILSAKVEAFRTEDAEGMAFLGMTDLERERLEKDEKLPLITEFLAGNGYEEVFSNQEFVVFARTIE
ncbi:MAG: hypothetical protein ACI4DU_07370 [Lachnospiraceae bacterium]